MGGIAPTVLQDVLQGHGAGGSFIQVEDVGADTLHGTVSAKLPAQGHQEDYGEAARAAGGWGLGVPTSGEINVGGGV